MISLSKARKDIFQLFTDCLADVTLNDQSVPVYDCIPPSDVNQGVRVYPYMTAYHPQM